LSRDVVPDVVGAIVQEIREVVHLAFTDEPTLLYDRVSGSRVSFNPNTWAEGSGRLYVEWAWSRARYVRRRAQDMR